MTTGLPPAFNMKVIYDPQKEHHMCLQKLYPTLKLITPACFGGRVGAFPEVPWQGGAPTAADGWEARWGSNLIDY